MGGAKGDLEKRQVEENYRDDRIVVLRVRVWVGRREVGQEVIWGSD